MVLFTYLTFCVYWLLFVKMISSCCLQVLVWNRGSILLETAMALGSAEQHSKQGNTQKHNKHRPQDTMHYLHVITWLARMMLEHLIWSFGIVVTSVTVTNSAKCWLKALHIIPIEILIWRTTLNTALQSQQRRQKCQNICIWIQTQGLMSSSHTNQLIKFHDLSVSFTMPFHFIS